MLVEAAEEPSEMEGANEDVEKENPEVVYSRRDIAFQDGPQKRKTMQRAILILEHYHDPPSKL